MCVMCYDPPDPTQIRTQYTTHRQADGTRLGQADDDDGGGGSRLGRLSGPRKEPPPRDFEGVSVS